MPNITLEGVRGRDVAERLARELELDPDRTYTVTVHAEDAELAAADSLSKFMAVVGRRAKERGLDAEILNRFLPDS